ncbi:MAG: rod-binding protein [Bacillota bacterium]
MKINNNLPIDIQQTTIQKAQKDSEKFQQIFEQAQKDGDEKKLMEVCKQFESVFVNMMLKNMRNTIEDGGWIEKSQARGIFEDMLDEKTAIEVSKGQGVGLANQLYKQLSRNLNPPKIDGTVPVV